MHFSFELHHIFLEFNDFLDLWIRVSAKQVQIKAQVFYFGIDTDPLEGPE